MQEVVDVKWFYTAKLSKKSSCSWIGRFFSTAPQKIWIVAYCLSVTINMLTFPFSGKSDWIRRIYAERQSQAPHPSMFRVQCTELSPCFPAENLRMLPVSSCCLPLMSRLLMACFYFRWHFSSPCGHFRLSCDHFKGWKRTLLGVKMIAWEEETQQMRRVCYKRNVYAI